MMSSEKKKELLPAGREGKILAERADDSFVQEGPPVDPSFPPESTGHHNSGNSRRTQLRRGGNASHPIAAQV